MGFKALSVFSLVSGRPPERPVVLTCVAQTGVVSPGGGDPGGGDQALRYYPLLAQTQHTDEALIRARG